ncbi:hypothetical protein SAMN05428962_0991 [Paenibacillus sp. BC26]|nr:hypothetical protein SAMN05428962_0991 [Paenibacillus sp. BC26]
MPLLVSGKASYWLERFPPKFGGLRVRICDSRLLFPMGVGAESSISRLLAADGVEIG